MKNVKEILVFDFETTGLSYINDEVIEIGAIKLVRENDEFIINDELQLLVKPSKPLSEKIISITGITDEMLMLEGVSQEEAFYRLSSLISDETLLVAYNIQFDIGFLQSYYCKFFDPLYEIKNDVLDVMAIYKDRHKYPHRLESAINTYNVGIPNSHRALDDAKATYHVLLKMKEEKDTLSKYINVVGYNKRYGVSEPRLNHVTYVAQYGGYFEIEKR